MRRIILLLLLPVATAAGDDVAQLRRDIAALSFLNGLGLSPAQAKGILPVAAHGSLLRRAYEAERGRLLVRFHDALVRFREEDLADRLSVQVMGEAGGLDHTLKEQGSTLAAALLPLEEEVLRILSPAQAAPLRSPEEAAHPLDLLRELHGSDFEELLDRLARELTRDRVAAGLVRRHGHRDERLRLRRVLRDVRDLGDREYTARRDGMLDELVAGRERTKVVAAIRRIHRQRYGTPGPLGDHLFRESMLPVLAKRAGVPTPRLPAPEHGRSTSGDLDRLDREIARLKGDINLLNLMNGLHLDANQLKEIARFSDACAAACAEGAGDEDARVVAALREIRDALERGETAPAAAVNRAMPPSLRRGAGYVAARRRELAEARDRGTERLLESLSPEQQQVVLTYKPCLVPPMNLRDPVRAGQANDTEAAERLLDGLRMVDLGEQPEQTAGRILAVLERLHGAFPPDERPCKVMLLLGVAFEAQGLDPVVYAAQRTELAERLAPLYRLQGLEDRLRLLDGDAETVRHKVGAFLLDPRIAPLAKDRIRRLASAEPAPRPDIPQAETCEDGECGKP